MTPEHEQYITQLQEEIELLRQQQGGTLNAQNLQAIQIQEEEKSLAREQLNLNQELEDIRHLLKGDELRIDDDGCQKWMPLDDTEKIILTDYGVHLILNTILFYMNKNTLLSNYEEDLIYKKMEDFATALADVIFMEYEKVFLYPTMEECKKKLMERIDIKTQKRKFAMEIYGDEVDEEELKKKIIFETDTEKEMEKMKEQIIKNKLKRFEIIIREIQDAVHSTYLRAYLGMERSSFRKHWNITENIGAVPQPPKPSIKKHWWNR